MRTFFSRTQPDQAAEEWSELTGLLRSTFSRESRGNDWQQHAFDAFFIHALSKHLWVSYGPQPCWSDLQPAKLLRDMQARQDWRYSWNAQLVATIGQFYGFLVRRGHLTKEQGWRVERRLQPILQRWLN